MIASERVIEQARKVHDFLTVGAGRLDDDGRVTLVRREDVREPFSVVRERRLADAPPTPKWVVPCEALTSGLWTSAASATFALFG